MLVGLVLAFDPHVKTFLVLFVGEVFLFMGLELGLVYSSQRPPASS